MKNPRADLPLNPRDDLILFSLAGEDRHGYGIVKAVEAESGGLVRMDPSNLYRSLKRLMQQGLVAASAPRASEEGGERRRTYSVTDLGRAVVIAEAERLAALTAKAHEQRLLTDAR